MVFLDFAVTLWMLLCLVVSFCLVGIIRNGIRNKAVAIITVIDLTHSDCMLSVFSFGSVYASSLIGCLMSESKTLGLTSSWIFATLMYATVCYTLCALTITATLRCYCFGQQLWTVWNPILRTWRHWYSKDSSLFISRHFFLILIGLLCFQSPPGFFYSLYKKQTIPPLQIQEQDPFNTVYTIPLFVALIANSVAKLYSAILRRQITPIETSFFTSFEECYFIPICRIFCFYAIILMMCCDIFPLVIIKKKSKMKQEFQDKVTKVCFVKIPWFVVNTLKERPIAVAPLSLA